MKKLVTTAIILSTLTASLNLYAVEELTDAELANIHGKIEAGITDQNRSTIEELVKYNLEQYISNLHSINVPQSVIDAQINALVAAQERAMREAQQEAARKAIMDQFVNGIQQAEAKYLASGNDAASLDLGLIFGAFYQIPEIRSQLDSVNFGNLQNVGDIEINIQSIKAN